MRVKPLKFMLTNNEKENILKLFCKSESTLWTIIFRMVQSDRWYLSYWLRTGERKKWTLSALVNLLVLYGEWESNEFNLLLLLIGQWKLILHTEFDNPNKFDEELWSTALTPGEQTSRKKCWKFRMKGEWRETKTSLSQPIMMI